ncbi:MAG: DUF1573 domain-containing protein [Cyclobacteriaceae bacterium]|nr:DUF1573 domain-containing protein [Cyclobacteriaceae bacterium HetDA_MAG_MS6]
MTTLFLGIAVAVVAGMAPSITWTTMEIDLGTVTKDEKKSFTFEFTNESLQAVTILEAKGSCGCTVVDYEKAPIEPGASAGITAEFRSGKTGVFRKNIQVRTSDSPEFTTLYFTGSVVE